MSVTAHNVAGTLEALDVVVGQPDFATARDAGPRANIVRHGDALTATSFAKCLVDFFKTPRKKKL